MTRQALLHYLIDGKAVGKIAEELGESRAMVRSLLKVGGIILRPISGAYSRGRDSVCDAVARLGYKSFHNYAQVKSLDPVSSQAAELNVTERSVTKVYNAYQRLLDGLKSAGIVIPTSQMSGADVERPAGNDATG